MVRDGRQHGLSEDRCTPLTEFLKKHKSVFISGWENPPSRRPVHEVPNWTEKTRYSYQGIAIYTRSAPIPRQVCRHTSFHEFFLSTCPLQNGGPRLSSSPSATRGKVSNGFRSTSNYCRNDQGVVAYASSRLLDLWFRREHLLRDSRLCVRLLAASATPRLKGALWSRNPERSGSVTRALPGLPNSTSYFRSTIERLFAEFRGNVKAWLDNFSIHARSETGLLDHLETFFRICS